MQWLAEICVKRPVFATMLDPVARGRRSVLVPESRRRSFSEDRFSDDHDHGRQSRRFAAGDRDRDHRQGRGSRQYDQRHRRAALDFDRGHLAGLRRSSCSKRTLTSRPGGREPRSDRHSEPSRNGQTADGPKARHRRRTGSANLDLRTDIASRSHGDRQRTRSRNASSRSTVSARSRSSAVRNGRSTSGSIPTRCVRTTSRRPRFRRALRIQNIEFPSGRIDEGQTETRDSHGRKDTKARAVRRCRRRDARHLSGQGQRPRLHRRRRRGDPLRGTPERSTGRHADRFETVRPKHGRRRPRDQRHV